MIYLIKFQERSMYYSDDIINKIGSDKDLAIRLDKAMSGVKEGFIPK